MYFQSSYQTLLTLSGSYYKKIPHIFLQLTLNTTDILREFLPNYTIVKTFSQSSYHTNNITLSESYYHTILTYTKLKYQTGFTL